MGVFLNIVSLILVNLAIYEGRSSDDFWPILIIAAMFTCSGAIVTAINKSK